MNAIKSKLNGNRGATLIFAMVALVIAIIVCAVVIYAAQSNAGRIRSAQAAEQAHLTLNSAASVVREQLAGNSVRMSNTYTTVTESRNGVTTTKKTPGVITVTYQDKSVAGAATTLAKGTYTVVEGKPDLNLTGENNLTPLQQKYILEWAIRIISEDSLFTDSCREEDLIVKASAPGANLQDVKLDLRMEPGPTNDLTSQDKKDEADRRKFYIDAVFSIENTHAETITMSFAGTPVTQSPSSRLLSAESHTDTDANGQTISVSRKVIETVENFEIDWKDSDVVVNVATSQGG